MKNIRKTILFLGDIAILVGSFFLTIYIGFWREVSPEIINLHILPFIILYLMWLIILFVFNFYDLRVNRPTIDFLRTLSGALLACFLFGVLFFYTIPIFKIAPKLNLVINILTFGVLLLAWRRIFYSFFSSKFQDNVVIIGDDNLTRNLSEELNKNPQYGLRVIGFEEANNVSIKSLKEKDATIVIIAQSDSNSDLLKKLLNNGIKVLDTAYAYEQILHKIPVEVIDVVWIFHNIQNTRNFLYQAAKYVMEFIIALITLIVTSPFLLIVAVAIKLDSKGPILIKLPRTGKNGRIFQLIKFRSMLSLTKTGLAEEKDQPVWSSSQDSRITRVGKIIRKLHIDEVPQMINILRGDISLVGPRPEHPKFVAQLEQEIPLYDMRHLIKPGFTGWAQIKFRYARSVDDSKEKLKYDLYYIKNRNLFLDIGIIMRTAQIIFTH